MLKLRLGFLVISIISLLASSCKEDRDEFNPTKLNNDEVTPPIYNRISKIEFRETADFVLKHKNVVSFEEDTATKRLWARIKVANKNNDILLYEPEYTLGRLTKLLDRTGSNQDIEIEYSYDQSIQKHLVSKIRYFKLINPYSLTFSYANSKLISISAIEIEANTRFERPFAYETLNVCQYIDSCSNNELQYQFTNFNNAYYLSNEILPIILCFSDFDNDYAQKTLKIARFLPLYIYKKLPYSYSNSKYSYNIDFVKEDLFDMNYQIVKQNAVNLYDYSIHFYYRY